MKRIGGSRRKTRAKMRIPLSYKGKLPIRKYLQSFEEGEKVLLKAYPGEQRGLFELRFQGRTGEIVGKQGSCYKVEIKDGKTTKMLLINPVHLVKA